MHGSRIRVVKWEGDGIYIPTTCQQCEKPVCVDLCPTGALYQQEETGNTLVEERRCIGCRMCIVACPFGAVSINPSTRVAVKCDLCNGDPKCARYCPTGALDYVRYDKITMQQKRRGIQKLSGLLSLIVSERDIVTE